MVEETDKVRISLFCPSCFHEWEQFVTREELKKLANKEPISECPNPECKTLI